MKISDIVLIEVSGELNRHAAVLIANELFQCVPERFVQVDSLARPSALIEVSLGQDMPEAELGKPPLADPLGTQLLDQAMLAYEFLAQSADQDSLVYALHMRNCFRGEHIALHRSDPKRFAKLLIQATDAFFDHAFDLGRRHLPIDLLILLPSPSGRITLSSSFRITTISRVPMTPGQTFLGPATWTLPLQ